VRIAPAISLDPQQKTELQAWSRGLPQRQVERAHIILLAASGKQDIEIPAELRISRQKAARCRRRFLSRRPGRIAAR
jgi:hypothetical protein